MCFVRSSLFPTHPQEGPTSIKFNMGLSISKNNACKGFTSRPQSWGSLGFVGMVSWIAINDKNTT
jgi:hypothetical protein